MSKIISAFPGTGKSHFYRSCNNIFKITDSDSSIFDKSQFPANYIDHILGLIQQNTDIIMVSSHETVRKAMIEKGILYTLVYPSIDQKEAYIERYKQRGSPEGFIKLISENWESWIKDCQEQTGCIHIELKPGEYISDVLQLGIKDDFYTITIKK